MDKTLLILGGGPDQLPGVLKAKEMGIYTIVLDGNPDAHCKSYADEFYSVSIKHIEQIDVFIEKIINRNVDGVIAFGVDIPFIIAYVANKLNVNYTVPLESAELSENKFISKEFMKKYNISIPKYSIVNNINDIKKFVESYALPIVLKPVDNSASRGISLLYNLDNVEKYYEYALSQSLCKQVMIEKYLDGPQVSTESFVVDGKIYNIGFADRNYKDMEKFLPNIIENGGDLPSIFMSEKHKLQLEKYLEIISKELNIKNGVIKGDIVIHNDELYIIEFALRLSGGNFSTIEIPESTGVDFLKIAIKLHLNIQIDEDELLIKENKFVSLRYKFLEDINTQTIKNISIPNKDDYIIAYKIYLKEGDKIASFKTTNHLQRISYVISKSNMRNQSIKYANNFLNKIKFS
ncbi:ATP-grasp domain-containing protein [Aliarcobacter butzleri]|uniref:ATP-grasp domain-containing protein n=1 Tax=Aliarcobacter butzleri TaxID=28197 RepID=UPI0021B19AF3|nr:ATP-grasp domain-containing protein [Aliarcobacter butzleri]MCT7594814.1 ATP-grasp domain-containing protein [Aliarcobacter butzleri]MCT7599385.1 ATP-grasp domain-containing protein [Aliarcobacter butzleri]